MTRSTIPRPASEAEWLTLRHDYWNASEAAVLVGEHPFTTLADVAVRKITRTLVESSRAMTRGRHLEAAIAEWWADDLGVQVIEPNLLYVFDDVVMATLDRRIVGNDADALEVKTTARRITEPESYWWWQCQAQMLCTDLERIHLAVLDGSLDLSTYEVVADEHAMTFVAEEAAKAMAFIRRGELPPSATLAYRHHERLHPRPTVEHVELSDGIALDVTNLDRVRNERRALEAEEETLKGRIAEAMGDAGVGTWQDQQLVSWRSVTRSGIDLARLRREQPVIAAQYRTESSYRQLRVLTP